MAYTPERKVKARVRKILDEIGAYYIMPVTGGYGNSGAPDFVVCISGRFLGIECKANRNKPTPLQDANLRRIEAAGGMTYVIDDQNVGSMELILPAFKNAIQQGEKNEQN